VKLHGAFCSLLALAGVVGCCPAQISPAKGGGYLFRVKYTKGQTMRFQTESTVANKGSKSSGMSFKAPMTIQVLNVVKGVATVNVTKGAGTLNGQPFGKSESVHAQLDETDSSSINGPQVPLKPIQTGGTWKAIRAVSFGGPPQNLNAVYRFQGFKTVDGHKVAVVVYSLTGAASGAGTMLLQTNDASIYSNEILISVPSVDKFSKLRILMTRLPEQKVVHQPRN